MASKDRGIAIVVSLRVSVFRRNSGLAERDAGASPRQERRPRSKGRLSVGASARGKAILPLPRQTQHGQVPERLRVNVFTIIVSRQSISAVIH